MFNAAFYIVARPAVLRQVAPPTGRSFRRSAVPTADPSLSRYSPQTPSHESEFPNPHAINKIVCPHHVTRSTPCYSGPVRAPAFRERQTGAPRPGCKSSPWPPSVSRSTDRVTQDNGIDPKPFWRLRAIPGAAPHQAAPGAPLAGRPGVGNCLSAPRTTVSGEKWGLPGLPPICSASCLRNKGLSLKRIGWLYPIFRQFPTLSMGENFEIPATDCHQLPPALAINASMQHKKQDLTHKQGSGGAAPPTAKNLPEMAARPPLEGGKSRFSLARRSFSHATCHESESRPVRPAPVLSRASASGPVMPCQYRGDPRYAKISQAPKTEPRTRVSGHGLSATTGVSHPSGARRAAPDARPVTGVPGSVLCSRTRSRRRTGSRSGP